MNKLNFRTLKSGHKADHVIKTEIKTPAHNQIFIIMYLIYIGIYNITDALFFVHILSLTNHGKHCRHPTILTTYGIAWQLTMFSYGIFKNIPRAWALDFP